MPSRAVQPRKATPPRKRKAAVSPDARQITATDISRRAYELYEARGPAAAIHSRIGFEQSVSSRNQQGRKSTRRRARGFTVLGLRVYARFYVPGFRSRSRDQGSGAGT